MKKIHYYNNGISCNQKFKKDSNYQHSAKTTYISCKHCLKRLKKGVQLKLDLE